MRKTICLLLFLLCIIFSPIAGETQAVRSTVKSSKSSRKKKKAKVQYGTASFYHNKFNGRKTANGDVFSQRKLTCAHNNVPLGTWLRVTNLQNGKSVIVEVIDRLHRRNKRLIDLSKSAANRIGFSSSGLLSVKVEVLGNSRPVATRK